MSTKSTAKLEQAVQVRQGEYGKRFWFVDVLGAVVATYGAESPAQGCAEEWRERLASFLSHREGAPLIPGDIMETLRDAAKYYYEQDTTSWIARRLKIAVADLDSLAKGEAAESSLSQVRPRCEDCIWHGCAGLTGGCGCKCHKELGAESLTESCQRSSLGQGEAIGVENAASRPSIESRSAGTASGDCGGTRRKRVDALMNKYQFRAKEPRDMEWELELRADLLELAGIPKPQPEDV